VIWVRDHVLPGVATWAITGGAVWVSHRKLWRRIKNLTEEQTAALKDGDGRGRQ